MDNYLEKLLEDINKLSQDLSMLSELDVESLSVLDVHNYINELRNAANKINELESKVEAPITEDVTEISTINKCKEQLRELKEKININELIEKYANKKIEDYVKTMKKAEKNMSYLLSRLNVDFSELHEINEEISGLVTEYEGLKSDANNIIGLINEINNPYNVSPKELKERLEKIKTGIKVIKNKQINNYNRMVTVLNNRFDELARRIEDMPEELRAQFVSMIPYPRLELSSAVITKYDARSYLDGLNYEELKRQFLISAEMEKKLDAKSNERMPEIPTETENNERKPVTNPSGGEQGEKPSGVSEEESLDAELKNIEDRIALLDESYKEEMTYAELSKYMDDVDYVDNLIELFITKLFEAKDEIKNNENIAERVRKSQETMEIIKNRLIARRKEVVSEVSEYKDLLNRVDRLESNVVNTVDMLIEPAFENNKVSENAIEAFKNNLNKLETELQQLQEEINKLHEDGGLTDEQHQNLVNRLTEVNEQITNGRSTINAFETMKETGFLDLLNGEIDGLEAAIEAYGHMINEAGTPVNKANRKIFDSRNNEILKDIAQIEANLEKYKETDPEKYENELARLNACKEKLAEINKKYHSKCGFFVKTYRSAKKFYKKHKKGILVVAGLAAIALLAKPVLIPAIMHGNMLLGSKVAFLNPILSTINKGLGSAINASIVKTTINGVTTFPWHLATGAIISPNIATAALLRGIASVSLGSAPLIGGVVMSLKYLADKMKKNKDLKLGAVVRDKTGELKQKAKSAVQSVGKIIPNKGNEDKNKTSKSVKEALKGLRKLSPEELNEVMQSLTEEQKSEILTALRASEETDDLTEELDSETKGMRGR